MRGIWSPLVLQRTTWMMTTTPCRLQPLVQVTGPPAWSRRLPTVSCASPPAPIDEELVKILSEAVQDLGLDWSPPEQPTKNRLDMRYLQSGRQVAAPQRPAPFFLRCMRRSRGLGAPPIRPEPKPRDHVCSHLSTEPTAGVILSHRPSKKRLQHTFVRPHVGGNLHHIADKAYMAAGQAASAIHTMAVLQAFQAKMLQTLDEEGPEKTAQGICRCMGSLITLQRHLWLTLTDMRESEKAQLLDTPISPLGLFGDAVGSFSEKFLEAQKQSKAMSHFLPKRDRSAAPPPRSRSSSSQRSKRRERPPPTPSAGARVDPEPAIHSSVPDCGGLRGKRPPGETDDEPLRKRVRLAAFHLPVPSHVAGNSGKCLFPIKFALKHKTNTVQPKSSFPPHDGSQSRVISRVPSSDGALQGASPARSLSLSTSVSPAHAGGPVGAEGFNDAPQVVSGSPSSDDEPSRTNHGVLQPLSHYLDAWHALPGVSEWVLNTVSSGYTLQFARRPPRFSGVMVSDVQERDAPVLRAEIRSLLAKQAIEVVPPENMECGLYSRYFPVPKKDGGLRPILDLRPLNRALAKREFKMITVKQILAHIQPGDWFISVDLKDAYFHIQIAPRHRRFLRFAFEGRAYQFKVLPFGLALAPRTFTKCINAALSPLKQSGIRILNYLDDWLVIAQSRDTLEHHKCQLLEHLKRLGLTINVQKSKLRPMQNIAFLGMDLDSRSMRARLSQERMQSLISSLTSFKPGRVVVLKCFQRLLGRMAAAAVVCQLGLLHMRPLQLWLKSRVPSNAWKNGHLRVLVTRECMQTLAPWFNTRMFEQGVSMGRVVSRKTVTTDASLTGWGALCEGRPAYGTWTRAQAKWHINCLELKAVFLALQGFLPLIKDRHVLVRTDNTTVVSYINHQEGIRSRSLQRLAERFLLWADRNLLSIQAVHVPGSQNCGADMLSRGGPVHGEWRLHPQTIQMIWSLFGEAEINLGCSLESLAQEAQICVSPSEDYAASAAENQRREGDCASGSAELAQPAVVSGVDRAPNGSPVADPVTERSLISGKRLGVAPQAGVMEPACLAGECRGQTLNISQRVLDTIAEARAPSIRRLYSLKWKVFSSWCVTKDEDPASCDVSVILSFLQDCLDAGRTPSALKVYVAAISAFHVPIGDRSVGRHHLVTSFLRGARRLRPFRPSMVPVWDLSLVLSALAEPPFEPLLSAELKVLSFKTALLLALACGKRVGDLHALSTNTACMEFGKDDCMVRLQPKRGYVPKVLSTSFKAQVITLQAFAPQDSEPAAHPLCPVRALRVYLERTSHFRQAEQLFICFGGRTKGLPVSKQRLSHWIVEAIALAYASRNEACPWGVHAHSTRKMASSWAWAKVMYLQLGNWPLPAPGNAPPDYRVVSTRSVFYEAVNVPGSMGSGSLDSSHYVWDYNTAGLYAFPKRMLTQCRETELDRERLRLRM
ncbi:Transposon Ty3-G Gag-Pol polyprotein [Labeo rohita]|uniref:ribonuclease H n=1 Tax=Labeo rohita TaxID=84645 RepID=A0ABQ8MWY7_LABRO|nr:Transposon Ty3-G Gag-Pol polyprotein [Labeo rohita]